MRILYLPNAYSQQRQKEKPANIYPVRMAMEAEWYRKQGHEVFWSNKKFVEFTGGGNTDIRIIQSPENLPFLTLPRPDRFFTRAKEYNSGNYKYLPGTHIMSASGCSWGKCSFCVENRSVDTNKTYEVRPVEDVISEIEECKALGFREIFDDSATLPTGGWLDEFLPRLKKIGIRFSANFRIIDYDYKRLSLSGFRMLLFGIESANQITLDKINKGVKVEDIVHTIKKASESGLEPHIAVMFGYSWETDKDAERTLTLVHYLLRKGYAKTAQASFYTRPDSPSSSNPNQRRYTKRIYGVWKYPEFWFNQIRDIKNKDDLKYLWRKIKAAING